MDKVIDRNGDLVPGIEPSEFAISWFAGRVPAKNCPHYIAGSEADAGFTTCEWCEGLEN